LLKVGARPGGLRPDGPETLLLRAIEEDPPKCYCRTCLFCSGAGVNVKQTPGNKNDLHESYLKIPPEVFICRQMGVNVFLDAGELARAKWFWERRPKKLVLSTEAVLKILIFYGSFWVAAMCLNQQALGMSVFVSIVFTLVIAIPLWAFIDALRFARWSSDYRRAIVRLRQTVHR
jgi:hypothetical protein